MNTQAERIRLYGFHATADRLIALATENARLRVALAVAKKELDAFRWSADARDAQDCIDKVLTESKDAGVIEAER